MVPSTWNIHDRDSLDEFSAKAKRVDGELLDDPLNWLVVRNILYFPIYWDFHHPN